MVSYRFTQTFGRVRYVFRALVKSQSGYPYEPGASRKRKLAGCAPLAAARGVGFSARLERHQPIAVILA